MVALMRGNLQWFWKLKHGRLQTGWEGVWRQTASVLRLGDFTAAEGWGIFIFFSVASLNKIEHIKDQPSCLYGSVNKMLAASLAAEASPNTTVCN